MGAGEVVESAILTVSHGAVGLVTLCDCVFFSLLLIIIIVAIVVIVITIVSVLQIVTVVSALIKK